MLGLVLLASACNGDSSDPVVEPPLVDTAEPTDAASQTAEPDETSASTAQPEPAPLPTVIVVTPVPDPAADRHAETAVDLTCTPIEIHGEPHATRPVDTDGDGLEDDCEYADHVHEEESPDEATDSEPVVAEPTPEPTVDIDTIERKGAFDRDAPFELSADGDSVLPGWWNDPVCRAANRWWDGEQWTNRVQRESLGDNNEIIVNEGTDELLPTDNVRPLLPSHPRRHCGFYVDTYPLSCTGVTPPACEIDAEGNVTATRVMTYSELEAAIAGHRFTDSLLHSGPEAEWPNVPSDVALSHISVCLQESSDFVFARVPFFRINTPIEIACNMVWAITALPINSRGIDIECAYSTFRDLYLKGGDIISPLIQTGWAEKCESWLDEGLTQPASDMNARCMELFEGYNSTQSSAVLTNSQLCLFNPQLRPDDPAQQLRTTGRCAELSMLADVVLNFAELELPGNIAWPTEDTLYIC